MIVFQIIASVILAAAFVGLIWGVIEVTRVISHVNHDN